MRAKEIEIDTAKLYQLAEENNLTLKLEDELYSFKKFLAKSYAFKVCFENVCLTPPYKKEVLAKALPPDASPLFREILNLLIEKNSLKILDSLSEEFTRYVAKQKNMSFAEIQSVIPLSEVLRQRTRKMLEKQTGTTVVLKEKITPEILGGFIIKIMGGQVLDATLRHRLWDLKKQIIKAEA